MNVLAIIPARGGSKGIPHKNLARVAGRPLVDWTVDAANESRHITSAILSSDDIEILFRAHGKVTGLMRPRALAQDETSTEAVMAYVLRQHVQPPDVVVLLQPTSPLRTGRHIDEAVDVLLSEPSTDSVVSVSPSHSYLWLKHGQPLYAERKRRQEMEQYEENGAIYCTRMEQWRRTGNRLGGRVALYVMGEEHRLQIDSPLDLEMASVLMERRLVTA